MAGAIGLLGVDALLFDDPTLVPQLRLENSSSYSIDVTVTSASTQERLPVGTVGQECTATFEMVIDQGPTWTIYFTTQGFVATPISISRRELADKNWTVSIPTPVIAELESSGAPRPPPQPCRS
jgi:hypothetical protein